MKNKHTHPISNALNQLDEQAVHTCMSEDITRRSPVSHRVLYRRVAIAAACLALGLSVGLVSLLPLLRADDPLLPESSSTHTGIENPDQEHPFVNFRVLSYNENDSDEVTPDSESPVTVTDNVSLLRSYNLYLHFDCAEGESVTITSHDMGADDLIAEEWQSALKKVEETNSPHESAESLATRILMRESQQLLSNKSHSLLQLDATTYMWCFPREAMDYDVVSFLIRDENGDITGAGSVCIGLYATRYHRQLRAEILGAQRFDTPVSEEEATAYLDSLTATAEEAYASMDFTPQNEDEGYALAYAQVSSLFLHTRTESKQHLAYGCQFHWFTSMEHDRPETMRRFFLFPDGTYAEVTPEGAEAYDDMLEQIHSWTSSWDFSGMAIPLTDGRTVTFTAEPFTAPDSGLESTAWIPCMVDHSDTQAFI